MFISRFVPRPRNARSLGCDIAGTAGIEFALIVPVVLVMMLGAIEYSRAVVMARRFNLITATLGDLVAREDYINGAKVTGLTHAMGTIWSPYSPTSLVLQIVDVRQSSAQATKMAIKTNYAFASWIVPVDPGASPSTVINKCDLYPGLPQQMLTPGSSTIMVNAKYTFNTLFGVKVAGFTTAASNWTSVSMHAPRNLCVGDGSANCLSPCE